MKLNVKNYFKNNWLIIGLIFIFLVTKLLLLLEYHLPIWDEAVYIGMGKFLFSSGQAGLWEPIRPILLPLLLGFLWKIKLNPIFLGELLIIGFSTGVLILTYLLGKEVYNKTIGLIATALVAITPVFYLHSSLILTGIPATFFILLSLYCLVKNNFWLAGLFSGLAFLTRFPAGLIIVGVGAVILIKFYLEKENKKNLIDYGKYAGVFFLMQIPFWIFNLLIYYAQTQIIIAPLRPYVLAFSHQNSIFHALPINGIFSFVYNYLFYFIELFTENWLLVFFILGLICWIYKKNYKDYKKNLIFIPLIIFLLYFSVIINKQLRFSSFFLPMFSIAAAIGINLIYQKLKKAKKLLYIIAFLVVFFALMVPSLNKDLTYTGWRHKTEPAIASEYYKFLEDQQDVFVLTADPLPAAYVDARFGILYHDLDTAIKEYSKNIGNSDYIIYFNEFYPCLGIRECELKKELLFKYVSKENLVFNETYYGRDYLIFEII